MDRDASPSQALQVLSEDPALEPGADRLVVHSRRMGRDFKLTVTRPFATPLAPGQTFPAIVALDDGYGVAGPMARLLDMGGAMAPAFVISVWYPPVQENFRSTDLFHEPWTLLDGSAIGGGGAAFEAFLLEDLMSFLLDKYPIERSRMALFGHSAGGQFGANVMARRPDAFAAYVICSAPVDPDLARRVETSLAKAKGKRVYLAVGSHDDMFRSRQGGEKTMFLTGFARLDAAVRRAASVDCRSHIYPDEGHLSVYARVIPDAFGFVFPPRPQLRAPLPTPNARAAARYAGVYSLPDGRRVTITRTAIGQVMAQLTGLPQALLVHLGGPRFYVPASDLDVRFDKMGFTITGGGGAKWRAARIT